MKIYIIADTHFYHDKMVPFCGRPVDHTEKIVENWNNIVDPEDLVIHLGDVIFGLNKEETLPKIMARLNGKKILCRGNHDPKEGIWYMDKGFDFVVDYFVYDYYVFSHCPLTPLPKQANYHWKDEVVLNIHAHMHNKPIIHEPTGQYKDFYDSKYYWKNRDRYHLVQIEDELRPFALEEILMRK